MKLENTKVQLKIPKGCLKMNRSRGYAFILLSALMFLQFIDISMGAPTKNPSDKSEATKEEEERAVVSDIMVMSS